MMKLNHWFGVLLLLSTTVSLADTTAPKQAGYPAGLPPEMLARTAIAAMPMSEQSRLGLKAEQVQGQLLKAGSYDWATRLNLQRRQERNTGNRFAEAQVSLERGVRWGNKAQLDGRLADQGAQAALSSYEDAWHETARSLLKAWFDVAREENTLKSQEQQVALSADQLRVVERRVAAGDAPRLEALLAQADLDRAQAAVASARQKATALRLEFDRKYPALRELHLSLREASLASPAAQADEEAKLEKTILDANHEIELAQAQTALARLRLERAQSDLRADPVVGLHYGQERGGQDHVIGVSIAIPFGGAVRDSRVRLAAVEAEMAESREKEVLIRVGIDARRVAQAVAQSRSIVTQLETAASRAHTAADLAGRAYAEGETTLTAWLQARRLASEALLISTLAQIDALEALARAMLDAHQVWTPPPPDLPHMP